MAETSSLVYRNATTKDVDIITRRAVEENRNIGPYEYHCGFGFDPKGFFLCEFEGELAAHCFVIRYPKHSSFLGGNIVTKKFRGQGISQRNTHYLVNLCDQNCTIGVDTIPPLKSMLEKVGFERKWNTYVAKLSLEKIVVNLAMMKCPTDVAVNSISKVNFEKLLDYDRHVFGTGRQIFIEEWINTPGTFGFAAKKNDDVVGYIVIRHVMRRGGTEIGLAVAPLFADNVEIAKLLMKTTAEYCLSNEAVPKTTLEMFHCVGDNCSQDAPQLMNELEAELTFMGYRMYTKGIPPGRQLTKMYGITSRRID